ncbi:MAG: hypothetical protein WDA65_00225 [Christensenellales bacterium]
MKNKEQIILLILAVSFFLILAACGEAIILETGIGSFEYSQKFMEDIDSLSDETLTPAEGKIFLLIYLKPAEGTELSLDLAQEYFLSGTRAILDGNTYDIYCVAFERVNGASERLALVYEVEDKGYNGKSDQPTIQLKLPSAPK